MEIDLSPQMWMLIATLGIFLVCLGFLMEKSPEETTRSRRRRDAEEEEWKSSLALRRKEKLLMSTKDELSFVRDRVTMISLTLTVLVCIFSPLLLLR